MLAEVSKTSIPAAVGILQATLQEGPNATKYSVIYDLKSCEINLYRLPEQSEPIRLSLADELKKGPHYYDIPKIREQLGKEQAGGLGSSSRTRASFMANAQKWLPSGL